MVNESIDDGGIVSGTSVHLCPGWWVDSEPLAVSVSTLVIFLAVVAAVKTVNQEDS